MNMQWSNKSQYNSFNSMKGLTYYERYKNILGWMEGKEKLGPPVECNLDPYAGCNLICYFCITQRYLRTHPEEVGPMRVLPKDYMYRLVNFLAAWGVKGLCISGGGEPTLHKDIPGLVHHAVDQGMKVSMFTNGVHMTEEIADALLACQWVSLSINGADKRTYASICGLDALDTVTANMEFLAKRRNGSKTSIIARMLILPENYTQIVEVCRWAREVGLSGFNVRPVDFEREDIKGHHRLQLPIENIESQFNLCHSLETDDFKVFTVTEKYGEKLEVVHDFESCLATPLLIPILQDGNAYICVDRKMEVPYRLGSCYPDPESILSWWGSDAHRDMIKNVDINKCSRCTFGKYHQQITEVVRDDSMRVCFP